MKIIKSKVFANRQTIIEAMKTAGIESVRVYYCGSGDSGGIEEIDFHPTEGIDIKNIKVNVFARSTKWDAEAERWQESIVKVEKNLKDAVEDLCYDYIDASHSGWENNDGGSGEFNFDVKSDKINWDHNEYYTETNTTNHEL